MSRQRLLLGVQLTVVRVFVFDWCDVTDSAMNSGLIEPPDPVQRREFEFVNATPRAFMSDTFSLVEPDVGLSERIVIRIANSADGCEYASIAETITVTNGRVLRPGVAVMNESGNELIGLLTSP